MRFLIALLALLPVISHAAWERTGATPSGAIYRMAVPEGWRAGDGLVVYQHDLAFEPTQPPDLGPLLAHQLAQGYAVAASGYRHTGWALFASAQDNRELVERFHIEFGDPGTVLTYGQAMGGRIALQMAGDAETDVDGVLALCPSGPGHLAWEAALDLRVVYDAVCAEVDGGQLPSASDRDWLLPAGQISLAGLQGTVIAANRCLGVNLPSWLRSDAQQQRLQRIGAAIGLTDDQALLPLLAQATLGLTDLLRDPGKLAGIDAIGNADVDYGETTLNAVIRRIEADPFAALAFRRLSDIAGAGSARVLSLHDGNDPLVSTTQPLELERLLPEQRISSARITGEPGNPCQLTDAELISTWDALAAWVADAAQPDAVELQARCLATVDAGIAGGDCRIDPDRPVQLPTQAVRSRNRAVEQVDARFSGSWYDPSRDGEGWLIEVLDERTAQIYGFTFPGAGESGEQLWLTGTGHIDGDGVVVDRLDRLDGGGFADRSDAAPQPLHWGRAEFVFPACGQARLRVQGPPGYGSHERALTQLGTLAGQSCADADGDTSKPDQSGLGGFSGSFYDPSRPGQGVVVGVDEQGSATAVVFSHDDDGSPLWLFARGAVDQRGRLMLAPVLQPVGPRYDDFSATAIDRRFWGALLLEFADCDRATAHYVSKDPAFGDGGWPLTRLTRPAGIGACALSPQR